MIGGWLAGQARLLDALGPQDLAQCLMIVFWPPNYCPAPEIRPRRITAEDIAIGTRILLRRSAGRPRPPGRDPCRRPTAQAGQALAQLAEQGRCHGG